MKRIAVALLFALISTLPAFSQSLDVITNERTLQRRGKPVVARSVIQFPAGTIQGARANLQRKEAMLTLDGVTQSRIYLKMNVRHGIYTRGKGVSFRATATPQRAITFTSGKTRIHFGRGNFSIDVRDNNLREITFTNIAVSVDVVIDGKTIKLTGTVSGKISNNHTLTFTGKLKPIAKFVVNGLDRRPRKISRRTSFILEVKESDLVYIANKKLEIRLDKNAGDSRDGAACNKRTLYQYCSGIISGNQAGQCAGQNVQVPNYCIVLDDTIEELQPCLYMANACIDLSSQ